MIFGIQRSVAGPLVDDYVTECIILCRAVRALIHQPCRSGGTLWSGWSLRPCNRIPRQSHGSLRTDCTGYTLRPLISLRPLRTRWSNSPVSAGQTNGALRSRSASSTRQPLRARWSSRPLCSTPTRRQCDFQLRRMACLIVLFAVKLHRGRRRVQCQAIVTR